MGLEMGKDEPARAPNDNDPRPFTKPLPNIGLLHYYLPPAQVDHVTAKGLCSRPCKGPFSEEEAEDLVLLA